MRHAALRLAVLASASSALVAACFFEFPRAEGHVPGELSGRAIRASLDEAAAFSRVDLLGSARTIRARTGGDFALKGLDAGMAAIRVSDDADGDGWPERGGLAAAILPMHPDLTVGFVLLGDVDLTGTMEVGGRVLIDNGAGGFSPPPPGTSVIVYATRGQCFDLGATNPIATASADCDPTDIAALADRLEGGAEAQTAADAEGDFSFLGVVEGRVELSAILYDLAGNALGGARTALGPVLVEGRAGETVTVPDLHLPPLGVLTTRTVQLRITPAPADDTFAFLVPQGRSVDCADADTAPGRVDLPPLGSGDLQAQVPVGAWDLQVCGEDRSGAATGLVALPPALDEPVPPLWTVLTFFYDPCEGRDGIRDCDQDEQQAIPPLDTASTPIWQACSPQCWDGSTLGEALGAATCEAEVAGATETFDCDDDGDGQPDVTEPNTCLGLGRGTDLDGDGACTGADAFPQCAANNPAACQAGTNDVTPRPQVGGGGGGPGRWFPGPVVPTGYDTHEAELFYFPEQDAIFLVNLQTQAGAPSPDVLVAHPQAGMPSAPRWCCWATP